MSDIVLDGVPPAVQRLIAELREALGVALARIAALEAEVATLRGSSGPPPPAKTSATSSIPPAKGWKAQRPPADPDAERPKRGPKPGHRGVSRMRLATDQVDVVLPCRPAACRHCGRALPPSGGVVVARRQVVEVPPVRPVVVEAQRLRVVCRHCQHGTVGVYPDGFGTTGLFGPRLVATAALLHEEHHVAYARLVEVFGGLFGLSVSEGALVEAVGRLGQALVPAAETIGDEVRTAAVIGSDETSARVDGTNWWEWVFQTATAAYHCIVRRRNTAVVLAFLDGVVPQAWVSDLWKPQLNAGAQLYQICLAHQLRDLAYAIQAETGPARAAARAWAAAMAALLRQAIHTRNEHVAGQLDGATYAVAVATIEQSCDTLLAEALTAGWSYDLQTRFQVHRRGVLTFLHHLDVPPTNNASERSLRPSVVHRKVTGGFRSEAFAQGYAALRTVADTARKRGQPVFTTLLAAAGTPLPITTRYHLALSSRSGE
jgi:transposase